MGDIVVLPTSKHSRAHVSLYFVGLGHIYEGEQRRLPKLGHTRWVPTPIHNVTLYLNFNR